MELNPNIWVEPYFNKYKAYGYCDIFDGVMYKKI